MSELVPKDHRHYYFGDLLRPLLAEASGHCGGEPWAKGPAVACDAEDLQRGAAGRLASRRLIAHRGLIAGSDCLCRPDFEEHGGPINLDHEIDTGKMMSCAEMEQEHESPTP